jgi:hypothetical protein
LNSRTNNYQKNQLSIGDRDDGDRNNNKNIEEFEVFSDFGGYEKESCDALTVTLLGLGISGSQYFNSHGHTQAVRGGDIKRDASSSSSSSYSSSSSLLPSANNNQDTNTTTITITNKIERIKFVPKGIGLSSSLQKSFTKELFKPPKGLLIHGPAGTVPSQLPPFLPFYFSDFPPFPHAL